jgi:hypothetical protein
MPARGGAVNIYTQRKVEVKILIVQVKGPSTYLTFFPHSEGGGGGGTCQEGQTWVSSKMLCPLVIF